MKLLGNQRYVFPSEELTGRGVVLRATLPAGRTRDRGRFKAIATTQAVSLIQQSAGGAVFREFDAKDPLLVTHVFSRLAELDPDAWCEDTVEFHQRAPAATTAFQEVSR